MSDSAERVEEHDPLNGTEGGLSAEARRVVTERWCAILQQGEETEDYTFFELGGTSVVASQLILQLSRELDCRIPLSALFEHPTLREFRDHLATIL
ncbi:acyl carrier protein [Actinacidiphila yeochonensis]|uniref:acyl carrier protein n=1 Tax=Actinacidiphila yeochonensis TaxID=89050 RepID=UPI0012FEE672|nr:acyl carrier protein [Actinacidiphila yeochonensis]